VTTPLPRLVIVETSDRVGQVAIAEGLAILQVRTLPEARRHARDLAPAVAEMLRRQAWQPRDVTAVVVSRGPGSYTGLRVGIISAKAFAYATRCRLIAVDTFLAIASQTPAHVDRVDVLSDAQQDKVYAQSFVRQGQLWVATADLAICPFGDWLANRDPTAAVTGPAVDKWEIDLPPTAVRIGPEFRRPTAASLLRLGLEKLATSTVDDVMTVEPLYLRPSAAEQQWRGPDRT
jgi:tRNA threonylcarbamoyladenosine biosynthesis protein TsaB